MELKKRKLVVKDSFKNAVICLIILIPVVIFVYAFDIISKFTLGEQVIFGFILFMLTMIFFTLLDIYGCVKYGR